LAGFRRAGAGLTTGSRSHCLTPRGIARGVKMSMPRAGIPSSMRFPAGRRQSPNVTTVEDEACFGCSIAQPAATGFERANSVAFPNSTLLIIRRCFHSLKLKIDHGSID
jgi:hypothetical protein